MKKLLAILAIGSFVACNSGEETTTTEDSLNMEAPVETPVTPVDTTGMGTDTTLMGTDTTGGVQ